MTKPIALIRIGEDGLPCDFLFAGEVDFYIVDERSRSDRVYRFSREAPREAIDAIIGDSQIGHAGDERQAAIGNRIDAFLEGRKHLTVVQADED